MAIQSISKPIRWGLFAFLLIVAGTACSLGSFFVKEQPLPGSILFRDDFSDPASGWTHAQTGLGIADYKQGYYRIATGTAYRAIWATPRLSFSDVQIDVTATKFSGTNDNEIGVICRYVDAANFYAFYISSDGYYGIGKTVDGKQSLIGMDVMLMSDAIRKGNDTNHIRVECAGDRLVLSVNGKPVFETSDSTFREGDVGLIAGSFSQPDVDIFFDDFIVRKSEVHK